jgi:hypothetical protein
MTMGRLVVRATPGRVPGESPTERFRGGMGNGLDEDPG